MTNNNNNMITTIPSPAAVPATCHTATMLAVQHVNPYQPHYRLDSGYVSAERFRELEAKLEKMELMLDAILSAVDKNTDKAPKGHGRI